MGGLLTALAVGGAAGVALSPRAAVVNPQYSVASVATPPVPTPAALAVSEPTSTVVVVGTGTASAVPDETTVGLGVSATRSDVRTAVNQANADMSHLLSAIHKRGVLDSDIQTTSLSIYQQTNCCPSTIPGYTSSNQVMVTIHHLINVINLTVANPSGTISAARSAAMTNALARAQEWAKLAGRHAGSLLGLSEIVAASPSNGCGQGCGAGGGGGAGYQIQPGQTSFTVTITATYELLP